MVEHRNARRCDDTRSKAEKALDLLRECLGWPNWTLSESSMILAGMDPESPSHHKDGWRLLPGTDPGISDEEMQDRLFRIKHLSSNIARPEMVVRAAYEAGIPIPWLDVAAHDRGCRIPKDIRKSVLAERERKQRSEKGILQRNAATTKRHERARAPEVENIQRLLDRLSTDALPMRGGKPNISEIIRRVIDLKPELKTGDRAIRDWIKTGRLQLPK